MTLFDLILIAVSLSMDAFAVSICKGLSVRKVSFRHALICGVWFGGFQALMPAFGIFSRGRFSALLTVRSLDCFCVVGLYRCQHGEGESRRG